MEKCFNMPASKRGLRAKTSALSPLILLLAANVAADTDLYRCVTPDGKIEFRQTSCPQNAEEAEIRVEDRKTGWEPGKAEIERKAKDSTDSKKGTSKSDKKEAARARQEETCWKKRQLLDDVNWKLRSGYKPAAGVKLRRKRRQYEEYIHHFCR